MIFGIPFCGASKPGSAAGWPPSHPSAAGLGALSQLCLQPRGHRHLESPRGKTIEHGGHLLLFPLKRAVFGCFGYCIFLKIYQSPKQVGVFLILRCLGMAFEDRSDFVGLFWEHILSCKTMPQTNVWNSESLLSVLLSALVFTVFYFVEYQTSTEEVCPLRNRSGQKVTNWMELSMWPKSFYPTPVERTHFEPVKRFKSTDWALLTNNNLWELWNLLTHSRPLVARYFFLGPVSFAAHGAVDALSGEPPG